MSNYNLSFFLKKSKSNDQNTTVDARISIGYILLISPTAAITEVLRGFSADFHQDSGSYSVGRARLCGIIHKSCNVIF